jgi:hypothetical protein
MWKKDALAFLEVLSQRLALGTEENSVNPQISWRLSEDSELAPLEYKLEVLPLSQLAQFWFRLRMSEVEHFICHCNCSIISL